MRRVVVDASVAVKWVVAEAGSVQAARLLDGRVLHVPQLLFVEAANALWAMARRGAIPRDASEAGVAWLARAPLGRESEAPLIGRAHALATALGHPVYDCVYLALAIELAAPVVTADARFLQAVAGDGELRGLVVTLDSAGTGPSETV